MKKQIIYLFVAFGLFFSVSLQPLNAHCYSCNGGKNDGYCLGNQIKACVDAGSWWNSKCDLAPTCAGVNPG